MQAADAERLLPSMDWGAAAMELFTEEEAHSGLADLTPCGLTPRGQVSTTTEDVFAQGLDLYDFDFSGYEDELMNSFEVIEALTAHEAAPVAVASRKRPAEMMACAVTAVPVAPPTKRVGAVATAVPRGARCGTAGPKRTVPWRRPGSDENMRMRAAVWVYRFAPAVKSKTIQREFRVSVKSLMRYVYDSCQQEFEAYGLYFGAAGKTIAGMADRAVPKEDGRVTAASIGYVPNHAGADVPVLARQFMDKTTAK
eukprot:INCI12897.1.p1 GENE.INCI12897.1~~INCI12897.1.p1  ORF type:complete len:254 (-),score=38.61 INCI12897.1:52-813(-)